MFIKRINTTNLQIIAVVIYVVVLIIYILYNYIDRIHWYHEASF